MAAMSPADNWPGGGKDVEVDEEGQRATEIIKGMIKKHWGFAQGSSRDTDRILRSWTPKHTAKFAAIVMDPANGVHGNESLRHLPPHDTGQFLRLLACLTSDSMRDNYPLMWFDDGMMFVQRTLDQ